MIAVGDSALSGAAIYGGKHLNMFVNGTYGMLNTQLTNVNNLTVYGRNVLSSSSIVSSEETSRNGTNVFISINADNDDPYAITCGENDYCTISCNTINSCTMQTLFCLGECDVSCNIADGINCPYIILPNTTNSDGFGKDDARAKFIAQANDIVLQITMGLIICAAVIHVAALLYHTKIKVESSADKPNYIAIWKLLQGFGDMWSDIFFVIILEVEQEIGLFVVSLICVAFPCAYSICVALSWIQGWKSALVMQFLRSNISTAETDAHMILTATATRQSDARRSLNANNTAKKPDARQSPSPSPRSPISPRSPKSPKSPRSPKSPKSPKSPPRTPSTLSRASTFSFPGNSKPNSSTNVFNVSTDRLKVYLDKYKGTVWFLTVLFGFYRAIDLVQSKLFYKHRFNLPLKKSEMEHVRTVRFWNIVVFENIPQSIIQAIYVIQNGFSPIVIISMVFSILSIILACVNECDRTMDSKRAKVIESHESNVLHAIITGKLIIKSKDLSIGHSFAYHKLEKCLKEYLCSNSLQNASRWKDTHHTCLDYEVFYINPISKKILDAHFEINIISCHKELDIVNPIDDAIQDINHATKEDFKQVELFVFFFFFLLN